MNKLILIIALIFCQCDAHDKPKKDSLKNQPRENLNEEFYFEFGNKIHLKTESSTDKSLIVTGLDSKKIKTYYYKDTLITFDPVYFNETWELTNPLKNKDKENLIMGGEINRSLIPKNVTDLKLQGTGKIEYELLSMKIEIVGERSRGVYFDHSIKEDTPALRKENQALYEWLVEGVENSSKIILSDMKFKKASSIKQVEGKICFRVE